MFQASRERLSNRYEGADGRPLMSSNGGACGGDELKTDDTGNHGEV